MMLKQAPFQPFGHAASGGGGNATVPNDAPILPVQAFVDASYQFGNSRTAGLSLSNKSITKISAWISNSYAGAVNGIDLSSNALNQSEVNGILSFLSGSTGEGHSGTFDLSGGANATPTNGAANADAWNLNIEIGGDAFVRFNVHSIPVSISAGSTLADFSGNAMSASEVNALLAFLVANYPDLMWTLDLSGGTNAAPTGQGITDKNTLISNGWTVTTN
jgi:hypothetical protein